MRLAGTLVLVLCVGVFAGSASAGNGSGNGNTNGNGNGSSAAPGNSADAPGQLKKEEPAAAPAGAAPVTTAPAPEISASAAGVKPASDTAKDTHEEAASDKTKLYGNGQNAGEIAIKNGAGPRTVLHGPGNSQPHKASPCSGGHEVDVHALKAHSRRGSCGGSPPGSTPSTPPSTVPQQSAPPVSESRPSSPAGTPPAVTPAPGKPAPHDPAGEPASEAATESGGAQGVLATTGALAQAELPFTGLPLSMAALLGLTLLLTGLAIRKFVASVESGHEQTSAGHSPGSPAAALRSRAGR